MGKYDKQTHTKLLLTVQKAKDALVVAQMQVDDYEHEYGKR